MMFPKVDRRQNFDSRSRAYGVRDLLVSKGREKRIWGMPRNFPLDQQSEGACVGFGWSAELACDPVRIDATNASARALYQLARAEDAKMGMNFPDGASVLAGARVCVNRGHVSQYRWAFGIEDVLDTIVQRGPVVLGVNWYESMYNPGANGLISMNGQCVGGHCILATGYIPNSEDHPAAQVGNWTRSQDVVELTNSWGPSWGVRGKGYIRVSDLVRLLQQDGEACIATDVLPKVKRPWYQRMIEWL